MGLPDPLAGTWGSQRDEADRKIREFYQTAMELLRVIVLTMYFSTMGALALFGFHRLYLLLLLYRHRTDPPPAHEEPPLPPLVTVQIPIYNESNVAPRLIEALCRLDYPRDRLEIQILDDSTDDTRERIAAHAERFRREGHDLQILHRDRRTGFKAGALAEGLARARGEFIAVFDADFLPGPSFLRETLPYFSDPRAGMVQARWGHLNRDASVLTRVQALLLDGHFLIEHAARHRSGLFFNFNGTAGIWRRRCIEDAGGWQHDTLTEDLDLSYRAQLAGWRFVFLPATIAPAELPVEISSFQCQQHRWTKGSIQTARKLLPRILGSSLPLPVRAEALAHLTANLGHVLMVLFSVLLVPAMLLRSEMPWQLSLAIDVPVLTFSTLSYWLFYTAAAVEGGRRASTALRTMPMLMAVGVGLSVNNARAVLAGFFGTLGTFERTPKHGVLDGGGHAPERCYRTASTHSPWLEAFFAVYFTAGLLIAVRASLWAFLPCLLLFGSGYLHATAASLVEAARARRPPTAAA